MDIRPIETEADYDWALEEVASYFGAEPAPHTPQAHRFSVLSTLIGAYEDKRWPIEAPDPIDAIREVMHVRHLKQSDLAALVGGRSRASELLSRKRRLSMEQAFRLHTAWNIPGDILLRPAALARKS